MMIEMNNTELNSLALGIFVDSCQRNFNSGLYIDMMETVYRQADTFAYALFTDAEIYPTLVLPRNYILYQILEWVQGEEDVPAEWVLHWCNKWYRNYMDKLGSVASPDGFALRAVRAEAKRYLDELRQAERTVFSEAHFLRPNLPQELCEFHKAFVLMNERRHSSIAPNDVAQLLAYGYSCGVRAERKRKRT